MNVILNFWITFLMVYGAEADISEHFTLLGHSGLKTYYMSNTNVTRNYNEAISTCAYFNMVLARLETKKEHDDLNYIFNNSVNLPDRAYVGLSLLNGKAIQQESKFTTTYNVVFYPGNPSGDGTCLEILRERGRTGMNDLSCAHIRHFICEPKDRAKEVTTSEPDTEIIKLKEEISSLQGKNDELNIEVKQCLRNLIEIKDEKASKLNRCTDKNDHLISELNVCQSQQNRSQENEELRLINQSLKKLIDELKQNIDSLRLSIDMLNIGNSATASPDCHSDSTNNCDPRDGIDARMGVECENGGIVRSNGNVTECVCPVGFIGKACQNSQACYMEGNGYVELNRSSIVDGGSSQSSVSFRLRFSTTKSKGLLFWFGQDNLESSNEQDFMALFIEKRHLVYAFRLNGVEHRLSSSITINNDQQYYVIVKQVGNEGSIEITDYDDVISGHIQTINKDTKITLPGNLFLGGAPNLIEFTGGRVLDGFVGCIHLVANEYGGTIDVAENSVSGLNVGLCP